MTSKPQNISLLNSKRKGKFYLISCKAPVWKSKDKNNIKNENYFWNHFLYENNEFILEFREILLEEKNNISFRNNKELVLENIIDNFIVYLSLHRESLKYLFKDIENNLKNFASIFTKKIINQATKYTKITIGDETYIEILKLTHAEIENYFNELKEV